MMFRSAAEPMEIRASEFIGMRLYSSEAEIDADAYNGIQEGWEDIGEVNDVILSREGAAEAVLVDIGGFLGMGERQVAVDMGAIRFVADDATAEDLDDFFLVMNANKTDLEGAPEYMSPNETADAEATAPAARDTTATTMAPAATDPAMAPAGDGMTTDAMTREGYVAFDNATLTAERLEGATVYDSTDASIGDVSELVLDASGQITNAIVDVGGFLGLGAKPVSLSLDQLQILQQDGGDDIRVYVPMTKEQLEGLPTYEG
ncbi:PRC-barrel domain-containing protein [Cereibacter changlensis]|uniref:PRC-barrel domain-containing protein n=1 Tax=Cereibacter changlensis TaxID=402884 RepID=UPI0040346331